MFGKEVVHYELETLLGVGGGKCLNKRRRPEWRRRPFFAIGLVALVLMAPLAATSTVNMIRRLGGRRWQAVQRLAYPAAVASVLHTYWLLTPRAPR
jgi:DMSO/TMAO reductase YedYZ heme-binding membrane subunit